MESVSDAVVNCFIDNIISSDFLSLNSLSTNVRHIHVTRLVLKYINNLAHVEELSVEGAEIRTLRMTHVHDTTVSIAG